MKKLTREPRLYLAYGSNLNMAQMMVRCPTAEIVKPFIIKNWRLVFRRVADIEPAAGSQVLTGMWRVYDDDEVALDRYEGIQTGLYRKVEVNLTHSGEKAFFYVMNARDVSPPPTYYYNVIAEGYNDWGFDLTPLRHALIASTAESARKNLPFDPAAMQQLQSA